MACVTVTVTPPALLISRVDAFPSQNANYPANNGWVRVDVAGDNSGTFVLKVDGVEVKRETITLNAGAPANWATGWYLQMQPGTHNVCADPA